MAKKLLFCSLLSSLLLATLFGRSSKDEVISFLNAESFGNGFYTAEDAGLPPSSTAYTILNYNNDLLDGIFDLLKSPKEAAFWKSAFIQLRIIATVDPKAVDLNRTIEHAKAIEASKDLAGVDKLPILRSAYGAVARFSNDEALNFIKARIEPEFWLNRKFEVEIVHDHAPSLDTKHDGLTEAIMALAEMESADAERLLSSLMENETYTSKPNVLRRLRAANYYKESVDLMIENIQKEYTKRLELRGDSVLGSVPDGFTTDVPLTPPVVARVSEQPSIPKAEVREPVNVEVAEEAPVESSQWWLWLVGLLVVLGGVSFIRSKNNRLR
tara:strand:+ start:95 stop:1075 length:981 start_codon:yes stop_codon:yes gene_type:complete